MSAILHRNPIFAKYTNYGR